MVRAYFPSGGPLAFLRIAKRITQLFYRLSGDDLCLGYFVISASFSWKPWTKKRESAKRIGLTGHGFTAVCT
jgi:hypothetical protein